MTRLKQALFVLMMTTMALGQRGSFAGYRPIGYPEVATTTTPAADILGNRFGNGENAPSTTTQRLPIEANGDRELVERLSKLPINNQPFWFLNWKAIEEQRKRPQTYPLKPNDFAPLVPPNNFQGGSSFGNANTASTATNSVTTQTSTTPPTIQSTSGTRDVDVSSFTNNKNGLLGASSVSDNSNTAFTDNRNANAASYPTPNSNPNQILNTNQQAQGFGLSSQGSNDQSSPPQAQVSPIFDPAYPDTPIYPILDQKTRDPTYMNANIARPTLVRDRFRDYEIEEGPVYVPYGYTRLNHPLYYF